MEITSLLNRDVRSLSRGENQRIVIARALLSAPMLYVTHDPMEAIEICEEILMLESGKIIERGSPRELLA